MCQTLLLLIVFSPKHSYSHFSSVWTEFHQPRELDIENHHLGCIHFSTNCKIHVVCPDHHHWVFAVSKLWFFHNPLQSCSCYLQFPWLPPLWFFLVCCQTILLLFESFLCFFQFLPFLIVVLPLPILLYDFFFHCMHCLTTWWDSFRKWLLKLSF